MKKVQEILSIILIMVSVSSAVGQRMNVGITFQYLVLKQIKVDADIIEGAHSYSQYYVTDNRWKFFSGGQSIIIGSVFQVDYKKLYGVIEPSFELNTSNYTVNYPLSAGSVEKLNFQTLFYQIDVPLYVGYQFGATNLIRYSVFAGGIFVFPYWLEYSFQSKELENIQEDYFNSGDMDNILYNRQQYVNALIGFCLHFANLGKIDIRYHHRLGSPSEKYNVSFTSLGFGVTYYLPLNLRKKKIYYED